MSFKDIFNNQVEPGRMASVYDRRDWIALRGRAIAADPFPPYTFISRLNDLLAGKEVNDVASAPTVPHTRKTKDMLLAFVL